MFRFWGGGGGFKLSQNVQTKYIPIRVCGRGGFNLLDNVPNLGGFLRLPLDSSILTSNYLIATEDYIR